MSRTTALALRAQSRRRALRYMGGILAGCFQASCFQRIEKVERRMDGFAETQQAQEERIRHLAAEVKEQLGRLHCKNERVREFLKACEQSGDTGECGAKAVDGAMDFLHTQTYVTLYLRPDTPSTSIIKMRRGQLFELIKPLYLFPSTRFLIIVQPRGEGASFDTEARRAGDDVSQYIRFDLRLAADKPVLGPLIMPCKTKASWMAFYGGYYDRAQPGEPPKREERIRIWVFRVDC